MALRETLQQRDIYHSLKTTQVSLLYPVHRLLYSEPAAHQSRDAHVHVSHIRESTLQSAAPPSSVEEDRRESLRPGNLSAASCTPLVGSPLQSAIKYSDLPPSSIR